MIKNIDIQYYKCFENFKLENLSRINIISGENNVGKTALLECLYLLDSYSNKGAKTRLDSILRNELHFSIMQSLLNIEKQRQGLGLLSEWSLGEFVFNMDEFAIGAIVDNTKRWLTATDDNSIVVGEGDWNNGNIDLTKFTEMKYFHRFWKKNHLPIINDYRYVASNNCNLSLNSLIDKLKLDNKFENLKKIINETFSLFDIDIINNKIMIKQTKDDVFRSIDSFGDGIMHFLSMLLTIMSLENKKIFIDEIENGLHYSKLFEIAKSIIEISQKEDIQVFITTHDKDTIEAFAKASKEMSFKDISSIELYKDEQNKIVHISRDYEQFIATVDTGMEVR